MNKREEREEGRDLLMYTLPVSAAHKLDALHHPSYSPVLLPQGQLN